MPDRGNEYGKWLQEMVAESFHLFFMQPGLDVKASSPNQHHNKIMRTNEENLMVDRRAYIKG